MTLFAAFKRASPVAKVAVTWAAWATVCLSGYYFARLWAGNQRPESLRIRNVINDEFSDKLAEARKQMESREASAR